MLENIPTIPMAPWIEKATAWLTETFAGMFNFLQASGNLLMNSMTEALHMVPAIALIIILPILLYFISNRKLGLSLFALVGLFFVYNQGLWSAMLSTLTLVIMASLISVVIGIPLGILMAKSDRAESIIQPLLDFMQTMPAFVYLIPAVAFFGIGMVPGVFASVIFALPPTVRMTNLGIRQVSTELIEAADSFGSTAWQKLFKVELPIAKETIFSGINQTTMLALSMVVTASMIGAPGLGEGVLTALQRARVGNGFVNGLALVILAIIIDRFTQALTMSRVEVSQLADSRVKQRRFGQIILSALGVLLLLGTSFQAFGGMGDKIQVGSTQYDSEIASAHVIKKILEDEGFEVEYNELDPAVLFSSLSSGDIDFTVSPWLPVTQGPLYERYQGQFIDLGPNLEGPQNGLTVPSYMGITSIEDLNTQANQVITGIEPGAGITEMTEATLDSYPNLQSWSQQTSSTGAMLIELETAIANQDEIVITGWTPHWMFSEYDLTMLEDPKETMGTEENVHTLTRQGFQEDYPEAQKIIDNFFWEIEDMESVMYDMHLGMTAEEAAAKWVEENQEKVASFKR
ncbi:ABC transporter permease/substrate binding protein [Hutsoniella sourekii]|uniref:ABC transporter permease/substrate binding protein n=1 Tax=Hutsoniella sourekii TaxID=87650 RepID=UPI000483FDDF|nr:ABC transporter permease/substrate binding protein [Hutsoniella sourekii]